jgi:hypothetical protein
MQMQQKAGSMIDDRAYACLALSVLQVHDEREHATPRDPGRGRDGDDLRTALDGRRRRERVGGEAPGGSLSRHQIAMYLPAQEVTDVAHTFALVGTAMLGFMAGLFSFKVKSRWCPLCGSALTCPTCARAAEHRAQAQR